MVPSDIAPVNCSFGHTNSYTKAGIIVLNAEFAIVFLRRLAAPCLGGIFDYKKRVDRGYPVDYLKIGNAIVISLLFRKAKIMAKVTMPHPEHANHLCYLNNIGLQISNPKEYKALVKNAQFVCKICGRVAADEKNLCRPVKL